jgi:hypothetical protein
MAEVQSMLRGVVTEEDTARRDFPNTPDDYKTRLIKYIPAETVVLYQTFAGLAVASLEGGWATAMFLFVFFVGLIGTPLYLLRVYRLSWSRKKVQVVISTVAYVIWVFSLGGFQHLIWYPLPAATILLGLFTFVIAPFISPEDLSIQTART